MTSERLRKAAKELAQILSTRKITLSLAESCTGGMISSVLTDIPGASDFFIGCAVCYSDKAKEKMLNVSSDTLAKHGAVSAEVAKEMAEGARKKFNSDIAASATGIAGPSGGTPLKPVGTVFIAFADGKRTECERLQLNGTRVGIRESTAENVIRMIARIAGDL